LIRMEESCRHLPMDLSAETPILSEPTITIVD
ncbi:unnamed protein product, partial [marine sediment metagenome]